MKPAAPLLQMPPPPARAPEVLLRCPCCGTPNYSPAGLRAHCCRAKPGRARLTPGEIELARQRAAA